MKIAIEIGDRDGEGEAYENLGITNQLLGYFRKAIDYLEKHLKIAITIGDQGGEGGTYGNLGNAYDSLGDYGKAIEYHKKHLKIAKKSVIGAEKEEPMEIPEMLTSHWVTIEKPLSIMKNIWKLQ